MCVCLLHSILYCLRRSGSRVCDAFGIFCTLFLLNTITHEETNLAIRKRLLSLAYGYLGSLAEAEDVVQEALLRLQQYNGQAIVNPEAWLTAVATRLAIDRLRSAQHRREVYPGEWLPEPVFGAPTPEQDAITHSRLTLGLLYLLEKLEPEQRAVFVLREVFEHSYERIAEIMDKSQAACRQLMLRARAALERSREHPPVPSKVADSVVSRFIAALAQGDENELLAVIAADAILVGDGGGKVPSVLKPIYGSDRIIRFFFGVSRKLGQGWEVQPAVVNSGPGLLTYIDTHLNSVTSLEFEGDRIRAMYSVSNPDKLRSGSIRSASKLSRS
jgi:RNA polymerase sigma-70 factor, ECF subfamily